MIKAKRGGQTLKTGKIGRVNCLRQQMLLPGETMNVKIKGSVRLESLRERDSLRINAHLATFMTPLRWLWPGFTSYLKEGPQTALSPPLNTVLSDLSSVGIGSLGPAALTIPRYWVDNYFKVWNEWYKWPEDPDNTTTLDADGLIAVPLQKAWNRCRYNASPDDLSEYNVSVDVGGTDTFDVRNLAEVQARFKTAMDRDVLSYNRYMELIDEMYGANTGSREVDQVPMMVDQTSIGVDPREIPATDGASLGQWQSLFDFGIDHTVRGITAPEHCIVSTFLTIRFSGVSEGRHPLAAQDLNWFELVGDPEWIHSAPPQEVTLRDCLASNSTTSLGFLPAGWQWRADHDVIGRRIDLRDSFPMMDSPTTQLNAKDATRIKDAFRSQSLGDYVADVYFDEESRMPIAPAIKSYYSGLTDDRDSAEFPKQGKML